MIVRGNDSYRLKVVTNFQELKFGGTGEEIPEEGKEGREEFFPFFRRSFFCLTYQ